MESEILENLEKAVFEYDTGEAEKWAMKAVEENIDLVEAFNVLTKAIRSIGDKFGKGELWLPDLIGSAEVMQKASLVFDKSIESRGEKRKTVGTVVLGTVFGDIHTIGKGIVCGLLRAEGFKVYDLGTNIKPEEFVEAIEKYNPDILAMSALMSTTAPEQMKAIEVLKTKGLRERVKIMVGGSAVTQEFADSIGADGYRSTAFGAVELARHMMNIT